MRCYDALLSNLVIVLRAQKHITITSRLLEKLVEKGDKNSSASLRSCYAQWLLLPQEKYTRAIEEYEDILHMANLPGEIYNFSAIKNIIGVIYTSLKDHEKAKLF